MQQAVNEVAENPVLTEVVETATEMNLWDMATKGGWIMVVLALLSVLCVYIFVERIVVKRSKSSSFDTSSTAKAVPLLPLEKANRSASPLTDGNTSQTDCYPKQLMKQEPPPSIGEALF